MHSFNLIGTFTNREEKEEEGGGNVDQIIIWDISSKIIDVLQI